MHYPIPTVFHTHSLTWPAHVSNTPQAEAPHAAGPAASHDRVQMSLSSLSAAKVTKRHHSDAFTSLTSPSCPHLPPTWPAPVEEYFCTWPDPFSPSTHAQSSAWCARHSSNQICKTRLRCGSLNVSGWLLFPVLAAGRPFPVTVCEKRATRSISRQHPSRILRSILRPIAQPRVKELPFDAKGSGCPPAELNMCRLIGCDEIRRPWCIVCLNLGHLSQWEDCPEEWKMRTCFVLDRRPERDRYLSLTRCTDVCLNRRQF